MTHLLDTLTEYDGQVFRNTCAVSLTINIFDDLSDDPEAWSEAEEALGQTPSPEALQYNAIDSVFHRRSWWPTRFGDGTFPVWYSSLEIETTFHETAHRWKQIFLEDAGIDAREEPIYTFRTVFNVGCAAALLDLRKKLVSHPFLAQKSISHYQETQRLGRRLKKEGFPGLLTLSARRRASDNVVVLNKQILHEPTLVGRFLYTLNADNRVAISKDDNPQLPLYDIVID